MSMNAGEDATFEKQNLLSDITPIDNNEDRISEKYDLTKLRHFESRKSTLNLVCLTLGLGGLQGIFAVQFGYGSEYLTSLGLSKSLISLVWLAGPISGAVLQPYFCLCSDECESKWGRRRPFIVGGSGAIILSLLGQAWAPNIIGAIAYVLGIDQQSRLSTNSAAAMVVLFVITLNIAIQPVQGCLRALIVDSCPKNQQDTANAWAGRIISIANVSNYFCGYMDLPSWFPYLGHTQFIALCSISSILLAISIAVTCWTINETPVTRNKVDIGYEETLFSKLGRLIMSFQNLPLQVQRVCMVQFFAWMGWFPFLFYVDLYIRDKYLASSPANTVQSRLLSIEVAARTGSLGMLTFAVMSLFASVIIPTFVLPGNRNQSRRHPSAWHSRCYETISTWMSSIRRLWMLSHILFTACMLATIFISSIAGTILLVGVAGISWAVTIWAPYAIISAAILVDVDISRNDEIVDCSLTMSADEPGQQLGTVMGLHNVAIAIPQILSALICGFVFWVFDESKLGKPEDGVGWVLRIGGLSAAAAAFLTTRLGNDKEIEFYKLGAV